MKKWILCLSLLLLVLLSVVLVGCDEDVSDAGAQDD